MELHDVQLEGNQDEIDKVLTTPGTVAVATSDLARYAAFSLCLNNLARPMGSKLDWITGASVAENFNNAISRMSGDWIWIMGDDHIFAPDTLLRLLQFMYHNNYDMVVPLCAYRKPPFSTVMFQGDVPDKQGFYIPTNWVDLPIDAPAYRPWAVGSAGLLIRKRVIQAMKYPWFEVGQERSDALCEDIHFCRKARALGFDLIASLEIKIGHIAQCVVWPQLKNDKWGVEFDFGNNVKFFAPGTAAPSEVNK